MISLFSSFNSYDCRCAIEHNSIRHAYENSCSIRPISLNALFSLSFVSGIVSLYYKSDDEVEQDSEIQAWINDVAVEGFVEVPNFGKIWIHDCITGLTNVR